MRRSTPVKPRVARGNVLAQRPLVQGKGNERRLAGPSWIQGAGDGSWSRHNPGEHNVLARTMPPQREQKMCPRGSETIATLLRSRAIGDLIWGTACYNFAIL